MKSMKTWEIILGIVGIALIIAALFIPGSPKQYAVGERFPLLENESAQVGDLKITYLGRQQGGGEKIRLQINDRTETIIAGGDFFPEFGDYTIEVSPKLDSRGQAIFVLVE